jgi:hypothetical protein
MKMLPKWSLILPAVLAIAIGVRVADADQKVCTQEQGKRALDESDSLKDWNSVYRSFKSYAHCDDGAIAEGYSDTVGRLLADDWQHVDLLYRLAASDGSFKGFVLRHIDETIPDEELKAIVKNAKFRCPAGKSHFCNLVAAKAQHSISEIK